MHTHFFVAFLRKGIQVSAVFISLFLFSQCKTGSKASGGNKSIRTLMVGGGSSHDFNRWYKQADSATLAKDGFATVTYTSNIAAIPDYLGQTDVLYLSTNQAVNDPKVRQAILDFVNSGKGLVLAHAATWYNQRDWPEYNKIIVGGGARSHERYGSFTVNITNTDHPITKNLSEKTFTLKDELYRVNRDSTGAAMQVLAIATVPNTNTTYPLLWITKSDKSRIACLTLGHDGDAHDKPVYQELLRNAIKWAARK